MVGPLENFAAILAQLDIKTPKRVDHIAMHI